jgi:hypothetical protein
MGELAERLRAVEEKLASVEAALKQTVERLAMLERSLTRRHFMERLETKGGHDGAD